MTPGTCRHFNGCGAHSECAAGIAYALVVIAVDSPRRSALPCLAETGSCERYVRRSKAEVAAQQAEWRETVDRLTAEDQVPPEEWEQLAATIALTKQAEDPFEGLAALGAAQIDARDRAVGAAWWLALQARWEEASDTYYREHPEFAEWSGEAPKIGASTAALERSGVILAAAALERELERVPGPQREVAWTWCQGRLLKVPWNDPDQFAQDAVDGWLATQN